MNMTSDIFDSFVKIAQEKGIISNDSSDSKKELEKNHRADSLDISAIEALYGTKAKAPKGMEYESNIMEVAHPNSVVVSPSYDKLNGLVENEMERQNINLHIVYKTPDGLQTNRKYAEKELILSLVRVANDLDNQGKEELRSLADMCLLQASNKKLQKTAAGPALLVAGVAALIGGVYLKNHMRFVSDGLEKDHQKLMAEIDDMLESNQSTQTLLGAGQTYKPTFINLMQTIKGHLTGYFNLFKQQVEPALEQLEKPGTAQELVEAAKQPGVANVADIVKAFQVATGNLLPAIQKITKNFADEGYKSRQIEEKGKLTSLVDATQVLHGGKGLIADDFDDVRHALETYVIDIQNVAKVLNNAQSMEKQVLSELQQAASSTREMFSGSKPDKGIKDLDQGGGDLDKEMFGGMPKDLSKMLGFPG
jgi:predicted RecB family endonuclease